MHTCDELPNAMEFAPLMIMTGLRSDNFKKYPATIPFLQPRNVDG